MHTSKRFVIVSAGRSGSTLLGRALRSHRDVYCFGEILEGDGPEDWEDKGIKLARPVRKCGARRYISSAFFSALRDNTACCREAGSVWRTSLLA